MAGGDRSAGRKPTDGEDRSAGAGPGARGDDADGGADGGADGDTGGDTGGDPGGGRGGDPRAGAPRPIRELPSALDRLDEIARRLAGRRPVLFLDYDGTLTPIVDDPDRALLPEAVRETLRRLAGSGTVAVVSGRDLADVRDKVGLEELYYAGSHGFDILGPDLREQRGEEFLPVLDAAAAELERRLAGIPGVRVERKRFGIAIHYRRTPEEHEEEVRRRVAEVTRAHEELREAGGKKIFELRPAVEWDKGRALLWLLEVLERGSDDVLPVYIGDDVTDEDAFRVLRDRGLSLVVRGEDDRRPTLAHYALEDPAAVQVLLERLARRRDPDR